MTEIKKKHPEQVDVWRRVKRGEHEKFGFQRVHDNEGLFLKPTLLCCGGILSNAKHNDGKLNTNAFAKIGHGLLSFMESFPTDRSVNYQPNIDIVSVRYPESNNSLIEGHRSYLDTLKTDTPSSPTLFAQKFAEIHLFPLIHDGANRPLPLETIKRNLRRIQVLAFSYGNIFIQQVGDALVEKLKELHFPPEQIREATSQVLVVCAGPVLPPATGKASFTTVNIINIDDEVIANSYNVNGALKDLFHKNDMLVDSRNQPVRGTRLDPQLYDSHYPAKPLNILPIATRFYHQNFRFERSEKSNQWLVSLSQPIILNGAGDIIKVPAIPHVPTQERSNARGIFEGQKASLQEERTHQDYVYFSFRRPQKGTTNIPPSEHLEHAATPRILMSSLLINGMNNAIQNEGGKPFIPLDSADLLMRLPPRSEYTTALDVPLQSMALTDRYDQRLARGLDPNRPPMNVRGI